jgi:hypothetical protein
MSATDWIGLLGGLTGVASIVITLLQWREVNAALRMVKTAEEATPILPAWFTVRMMTDDWLFGLIVNDGRVIAINRVNAVSDDGSWLDVDLATDTEVHQIPASYGRPVCAVAADRRKASVHVATIVAALELQTS